VYTTPQALCFKFLSCLNKGCDDDDDDDDDDNDDDECIMYKTFWVTSPLELFFEVFNYLLK